MDVFLQSVKDLFGNYMLMSAVVAWLSAQIIKIFTGVFQNRKMTLTTLLFSTGGMPSSCRSARARKRFLSAACVTDGGVATAC